MKIFVGNLSHNTTEQELREALAEHEPILEIRRPLDRETGKPRGFAFITFATPDAGMKAMETVNGLKLGGRELRADEAEDRGRDEPAAPRRPRVSMNVEVERVDDRPIGPDGKRVRYKAI
ncbi:RNA-binding protein [Verrucomicrobiaceae bacterium E54]|nr:RNA-binding protein [Verrucomicrobiaceae bacterium E54]